MSGLRLPCTHCGARTTASATGICWACRPAPAVTLDLDGLVHIDGLPPLTPAKATALAHRIVDVLSVTRAAK